MKYFVIEGIDTSGKTTQHNMLKQKLKCYDLSNLMDDKVIDSNIIFINEPGVTPFGKNIRNMLLKQDLDVSNRVKFLLFLSQRADIFDRIFALESKLQKDSKDSKEIIESSNLDSKKLENSQLLDSKKIDSKNLTIIADRSLISGISYAFLDSNLESLFDFNLFATHNFLPQKVVFLELSKDELQKRLKNKKLDSIEKNGIDYLLNIQNKMREVLDFMQTYAKKKSYTIPQILELDSSLCVDSIHQKIMDFFFEN
ncbi:dTMP kinase [Helicobacter saguini]|uniref:Thymidylate kinase n=1 Tax=Helicobacter saguini TaxID=1548018 RepID=A0A347VP00_9HELI|nr:dTMP kinase [Helicobacter saguini]MWV61566.1 dTMP kinase [Helicobacter saguini]MWV67763.1 dTMP kinase [Helicobacter saguini]MWV70769.1 dTMP kinase [Helicobacter saguini]MWV72673.1 dTMP kinase [Helicobacter saguini]TLD94524.1 dTMP kinase [Helicobacter saguini]